jgi:dTDP-4-amino-4,6-dideoxygalactose transaminase
MIEYENLGKLNTPFFSEYQKAFQASLESGWYILGTRVSLFETEFAAYCGSKYCAGVASGLDALILALKAFDFKNGGEVIVPSNTYIATILAILQAGLKPVLVEPDIRTYNIDPERIREAVTAKTVAVMVVHLYGKCCEMDKIRAVCKDHDLRLIEDTAQAHGAMFRGKKAGTFGEFGAFSFYPTKNLGALGDAGSINTDDETLYKKIKTLRNYGSNMKYVNEVVGYNSRLDEIQAAFLSVKLKKLDEINSHKRKLANIYLENVKADFVLPVVDEDYYDVYHIFNVRHPRRDQLKEYLLANDIKTEIHYPIAPHKQAAMKGVLEDGHFPISEEIHSTTLSLPISYYHSMDDVHRVTEVLNKF